MCVCVRAGMAGKRMEWLRNANGDGGGVVSHGKEAGHPR